MRRVVMFAIAALAAAPVTASAQQSLNISIGGFSPRAEDARDRNDVLVNDRDFLAFNVSDLSGFTIGGDAAHDRVHLNGVAFRDFDFLQHARGGGGNLSINLVG